MVLAVCTEGFFAVGMLLRVATGTEAVFFLVAREGVRIARTLGTARALIVESEGVLAIV